MPKQLLGAQRLIIRVMRYYLIITILESGKMLVTKQKSVRVTKFENYDPSLRSLYTVFKGVDLEEEVRKKREQHECWLMSINSVTV